MARIPGKTFLTGFKADKKICLAKNTCIRLQDKYSQKLYPVCPILKEVIGKEKPSTTKILKTNLPLLDSIIKILVVFDGLIQLRPNLETVVRCVHSENFLKERMDLIRYDLSALPQWLEKDFPNTSKNCIELVAELDLAESDNWHSNSLVYFLPDDIEYGNWATVIEWRERQIRQAEHNGLSDAIEMNRLTCHYPAEAIKVIDKIFRKLCPLVKILSEKVQQSKREKIEQNQMLAGYLQKATEKEHKIVTPTAKPKIQKWGELTIDFIDDETIRYKVDEGGWKRVSYIELGFKNEKSGLPNKPWEVFLIFAEVHHDGYIDFNTSQRTKRKEPYGETKKRGAFLKSKDRICKSLKDYFGPQGTPIKYIKKEKRWRVGFTLSDGRPKTTQ